MGSLLFTCACNEYSFRSSIDNRSYAAHLIPDEGYWHLFWDAIDDAIEKSGPSERDKEKACMSLRYAKFGERLICQCPECGAVYIEDEEGKYHRFLPESSITPKKLLKGKE